MSVFQKQKFESSKRPTFVIYYTFLYIFGKLFFWKNLISSYLNSFFIGYLQNTWQPVIHNSNTLIIFHSLSCVSTDDAFKVFQCENTMNESIICKNLILLNIIKAQNIKQKACFWSYSIVNVTLYCPTPHGKQKLTIKRIKHGVAIVYLFFSFIYWKNI